MLCAINVFPGSGPCAACQQLSTDNSHHLARRNRIAEDRIRSLLKSGSPYSFPTQPLPYMGLPVLLARLEAAHKALHSLTKECSAQKREVTRLRSATFAASRPQVFILLEGAYTTGRLSQSGVGTWVHRGGARLVFGVGVNWRCIRKCVWRALLYSHIQPRSTPSLAFHLQPNQETCYRAHHRSSL